MKKDDFAFPDFGKKMTSKSPIIFYGNAALVSALPICKLICISNFCAIFVWVVYYRVIHLKHDSISKNKVNFYFKTFPF